MNKKCRYILLILAFLNLIAYAAVFDLSRPRFLEVVFFDVGQGDSIFIETQSDNQVLIDGGPSSSVLGKLIKEMPFYDRTIDLVILTHTDQDHLFGLLEVLKRYKVENIVWNGIKKENALTAEWEKLLTEENANVVIAKAGERIIIDEGIYIDIVHPLEDYSDLNDTSIISRLVFGDTSILMMADATEKTDIDLLKWDLKSDVLKVPHHGSDDSTSLNLLKEVSPKAAVISVGENNYGHPDSEVLERLRNSGIEVLRTDELGDIKMLSDGKEIKAYK